MNYFELLNIKQEFNLNLDELTKQYLAMQLKHHPDKASNIEEKNYNITISSQLNSAYQTLKSEEKRATYLLSLNNININNYKLSSLELTDIWNNFELIENISNSEKLKKFLATQYEYKLNALEELEKAFKIKNFEDAALIIVRIKYISSIVENIKAKMENEYS